MRNIKILYITLLLTLAFQACHKQNQNDVLINGYITNVPSHSFAFLYHALPTGNVLVDSVEINKNGHFTIKTHIAQKDFYILTFTGTNYNIYLLLDTNQTVSVRADYRDLLNSYEIQGSPESCLIQQLEQHLSHTRKELDSLSILYDYLVKNKQLDSARKIDLSIKKLIAAQKQYSTNFVVKYKNSLVALPALSQVYIPGKGIFNPENDAQLYFMVDSALAIYYPKNPHVLRLHSFVQNIKFNLRRHRAMYNNIVPGAKAPNFEAITIDSTKFYFQQTKGHKVFLLFTASWCGDCRKELARAHDFIFDDNIIKIAIMLDVNRDTAKLFAKKYLKKFIVICDQRFWNSPIVRLYHITKLPTAILIDKNGEILAIGRDVYKKN